MAPKTCLMNRDEGREGRELPLLWLRTLKNAKKTERLRLRPSRPRDQASTDRCQEWLGAKPPRQRPHHQSGDQRPPSDERQPRSQECRIRPPANWNSSQVDTVDLHSCPDDDCSMAIETAGIISFHYWKIMSGRVGVARSKLLVLISISTYLESSQADYAKNLLAHSIVNNITVLVAVCVNDILWCQIW